jgi:two-component sensor histidine kinase
LNNITQIKTAEERSKKALEENELLMKEIHHRVKNNLTVISSLLSMQSRYVKDKEDLEMFIESQNRAKSMAMIHEMLYSSMGEFKRINFGLYIEKLSRTIFNAYTMDPNRINLETDLENIQLDVDTAVPLGLILNELLSNALKYAFPEGRKGTLRVTFKKEDDTNLLLSVEDDGVGVPEKNGVNENSLGLILIKSLVEQINGNITIDNKNGLKINIRFPEMDYNKL